MNEPQHLQVTASNIAHAIDALAKDRRYDYPNAKTKTRLEIISVKMPEGPISIRRIQPGDSDQDVKVQTISTQMLWRLASAIKPGRPVNIDRVFGASYNTRSALEALILHTPDYYSCFPGRLEKMGPVTTVKKGHKHIMFCPGEPHTSGVIVKKVIEDMVISEVDREVYFDSLMLTDSTNKKAIDVEIDRRHAQIQVLLIKCAESMGLKTWVAKNDQGIKYKDQRLIEFESVMKDLASSPALQGYPNAGPAGELIDCIWFSDDGKKIPAIIEIEHSTGVTSGLNRMKGFMEEAPELAHMTYIIAAPDEIRAEVMRKACAPQFDDMNIQYLPYSAVEDLYLLCNRKLKGIDSAKFFHTFLEPVQKKS